jgi:DNA-directed RNA polymerase alpha subunit
MIQTVEIENVDDCNLCLECLRYCKTHNVKKSVSNDNCNPKDKYKYDKSVIVEEDEDKFIFIVESTGALTPVEIVGKAMKILKEKIINFKNDLAF